MSKASAESRTHILKVMNTLNTIT